MNNLKGQTIFAVVVFLGLIFILTMALFTYVMNNRLITQRMYNTVQALNVAEAGVDKAVWCLNNSAACGVDYSGEITSFGPGQFATTLTSLGSNYIVTSTGTVNNIQNTLRVTITDAVTTTDASFYYGVQVGAGGMTMENGSHVDGNIYSNGSINAGNGAYATGDVYVAGGTALAPDQEQALQTSEFSFGDADATEDLAQSFKPGTTDVINYVSLYIKKVSKPSNTTVRITEDDGGQPATSELTSGTLRATQVTDSFNWVDVSFESNPELNQGQTYWIVIDVSVPKSSRYFIIGKHDNAGYDNGAGFYSTDWSGGSWNDASGDFTFKTWMGGADTSINNLEVGYTLPPSPHTCDDNHHLTHHGDAHAHSIIDSGVECDAYYDSDPDDIAGSTVDRNKHPDSDNPPPETLPVSDGQILKWKDTADDGDPIDGDYELLIGESGSLGPAHITGNMTIDNGSQLTITGTLWVEGDIIFDNNSIISLDSGYGSNSGLIVADGKISANNNCIFNGSGTEDSYIMILTTNNSIDINSPAVYINNSTETIIFYAGDGVIRVGNADVKEVTAYKIHLDNGASVSYESGLAGALFADGPGGMWTTQSSTWQEID